MSCKGPCPLLLMLLLAASVTPASFPLVHPSGKSWVGCGVPDAMACSAYVLVFSKIYEKV